ncbi:MAG: hypothetical protein ACP5VP_09300 [Candidatus Limnocylindrales bacterium]
MIQRERGTMAAGAERPQPSCPQSELALGALRVLAQWPTAWEPAQLAEALGGRADLLAEVVARLVRAGWVQASVHSGHLTYRYTDPQPAPTLDELLHAVEGASVADDCVLGLGPCAGLSGGPVCSAHEAWLRELSWSALIVTPLLPAAARGSVPERWRTWPAGDADGAAAPPRALAPGVEAPAPVDAPEELAAAEPTA